MPDEPAPETQILGLTRANMDEILGVKLLDWQRTVLLALYLDHDPQNGAAQKSARKPLVAPPTKGRRCLS